MKSNLSCDDSSSATGSFTIGKESSTLFCGSGVSLGSSSGTSLGISESEEVAV